MPHQNVDSSKATAQNAATDPVGPGDQTKAGGDRDELAEATLHWVRERGRRPSDDFQASAVLRALEAALARTSRGQRR